MALSTAGVLTLLIGLAGQGWEIFLPVLSVSLSENAHAHSKPHSKHEEDAEKNSGAAPHGGVTSPQDPTLPWELKTERFPENPKVGEPMTIRAKLLSRKTEKTIPTLFKLVIKQLEHDQEVFSAELYEPDGVLEWRGSLFDGSAHKVHIVGIPLDKDIASLTPPQLEPGPAHIAPGTAHPPWATAEMEIDVEALEPTLGSIVKSFSLLMVISGISLSLGLWGGFATSPKLSKVQLGSVIQGRAPKST
jgi:hypothetical protein